MGAALEFNEKVSDLIETWRTANPDCPLEMPGEPSEIDKSGDWGRVTFLSEGVPVYIAAGPGSAERYFDGVQAEFFTLAENGRHRGLVLADGWAAIFRHQPTTGEPPIAGFTFQPTRIIPITRADAEGGRLKTDCLTAIERDFQP